MFGRVSRHPLNVKLLRRSDVRQRRAGNLDSTRPKDKPARHIKPAALIIQSGDGCLWQINVFYNSTLALHCNFSCRERKKKKKNGARPSINMHFIPSNGQKKNPKQMQLTKNWMATNTKSSERGRRYMAARQTCKHPGEFHSYSGIKGLERSSVEGVRCLFWCSKKDTWWTRKLRRTKLSLL